MGFFSNVGKMLGLNNPAEGARPYLDQIPNLGRDAYQGYINQGRDVDPGLQERYQGYADNAPTDEYNRMAQDPSQLINSLMQSYQQSPYQKYKQEQQLKAAGAGSAAGGYAGTEQDLMQRMQLVSQLSGDDMQQWIDNLMGVRNQGMRGRQYQADQGLAGLGGISDRGYQASGNMADYIGSALGQRAQAEMTGASRQAQARSGFFNAAIGAGSNAYGASQGRMGDEAIGEGLKAAAAGGG